MLRVMQLTLKREGQTILREVTFKAAPGTVTAVLGPSGAGKSTLLAAICQLLPYQGQILWHKQPILPAQVNIGWLPQDYGLLPWFTVAENISREIKARTRHRLNRQKRTQIKKVMQELGISRIRNKLPGQLSGGQKQRAGLAKVLALQPDLLLLDEPFAALDTVIKQQAYHLLSQQLQGRKMTTLLVTHDLPEALLFGDQLLLLAHTRGQVLTNPLGPGSFAQHHDDPRFAAALAALQKEVRARWSAG